MCLSPEWGELLHEAWSTEGEEVWLGVLLEHFVLAGHHGAGMGWRGIYLKPGSSAAALSLGLCPGFHLQHLHLCWLGLVFVASLWLPPLHCALVSATLYRKVHLL